MARNRKQDDLFRTGSLSTPERGNVVHTDPSKGDPFDFVSAGDGDAGHQAEPTDEAFAELAGKAASSAVVEVSFAEAKVLAWSASTAAQLAHLEGHPSHAEPLMQIARLLSSAVSSGELVGELRVTRRGLRYLSAAARIIVWAAKNDRYGPVGYQMAVAYWNGIRSHLSALGTAAADEALAEFERLCPSPDRMAAFAASAADMFAIRADLQLLNEFTAP